MLGMLASVIALGVLTACGLVPGVKDPACQAHADPADCEAALDAGMEALGLEVDSYVVSVDPISCAEGACTTWVRAVPAGPEDCVPTYEAEVLRDVTERAWAPGMVSHADPPCAFEP